MTGRYGDASIGGVRLRRVQRVDLHEIGTVGAARHLADPPGQVGEVADAPPRIRRTDRVQLHGQPPQRCRPSRRSAVCNRRGGDDQRSARRRRVVEVQSLDLVVPGFEAVRDREGGATDERAVDLARIHPHIELFGGDVAAVLGGDPHLHQIPVRDMDAEGAAGPPLGHDGDRGNELAPRPLVDLANRLLDRLG